MDRHIADGQIERQTDETETDKHTLTDTQTITKIDRYTDRQT